jgi:DASS family divalent anion:Na+ symporter
MAVTTGKMEGLQIQLKVRPALCVLALFLCLWFIPCPEGVDPKGWKVFAVFVSTIFGFLTKPMPLGAIVLTALTVLAATKVLTIGQMVSGFGNSSVWLIVMAFFISRGFTKTGLGTRIGYMFIRAIGHTTLGLAYALGFTNYVLAPAMPSSTARSGGTVCPLTLAVARAYGSDPELGTQRKIGSYLIFNSFQTNYPVGAAFMTAMAGNTLAAGFAAAQGVEITWLSWWWAGFAPSIASILSVPLFLLFIYPPEIKHSTEARELAIEKLKEMGPMSKPEKAMLGAFFLLLFMWVVGSYIGLDATTAAFIGITLLVYAGVLTWQDVLSEKGAYDCLVWFSGLILMAGLLNRLGVIKWITGGLGTSISGLPWPVIVFCLACSSMYIAYCFASSTALIGAVYSAYLAIGLAAGTPPMLTAMVIAFFCNLQACLTYYSGGSAPIFFATGYVESGDWLRCGFLVSVLHLVVWFSVGSIWWKVIGLY